MATQRDRTMFDRGTPAARDANAPQSPRSNAHMILLPVLHVGVRARVAFAGFWIVGQASLVLSAPLRADRVFGFRMFPEASTMEIHLAREVGGERLPAPLGLWNAHDRLGKLHPFAWRDRVRDSTLGVVDARVFASYGVDAQLARLQRALDDVVDHIPEDAETTRLCADVLVRRNGREANLVTLLSHRRQGP